MSVLESIQSFIQTYYIDPLVLNQGYTLPMTITYGLFLALAVYLIYPRIRSRVTIDRKFVLGVIPYVVLGGVVRVLEDAAEAGINPVFKTIWLISPLIFVTMFAFTLSTLLVSLFVSKHIRKPYHLIWGGFGTLCVLFGLALSPYKNLEGGLIVAALTLGWLLIFYGLSRVLKREVLSPVNIGLLTSHMFDASATYTAIRHYGYWEQHVLPSFLIDLMGPEVMFLLKIVVVLVVLHFFDQIEDREQRTFWKLVVLILGLALGIRDTLRLVAGV